MKQLLLLVLFTITLMAKPDFSKEELEWIKNNPVISVGGEVDWAPFDFVKDKEYQGITNDYLKLISQKSGLKFDVKIGYTWNQLIDNFKEKNFDILPAVYYAPSREEYGIYTTSYFTVRDYLFVKKESKIKSFEDLDGKILAIPKGYTTISKIKKEFPNITILETRSIVDSIASVLSEQADATLEVHAVMAYNLKTNAIEGLKVIAQDRLGVNPLHMLVQKDKKILQSIINKSILEINKDEQNEIATRWISTSFDHFIDPELATQIGGVFLLIIVLFIYRQKELSDLNKKLEEDKRIIKRYLKIVNENVIISSTDTTGTITSVSEAFCKISGYKKEELIGKNHNIVRHPDMKDQMYKKLWSTIQNGEVWNGEIKNKKKNGEEYWVDATISPRFDDEDNLVGFTAIREDITDKKIIEEISITDGLTAIYNRRHFNDLFPKFINSAKRKNDLISFLIMDIDSFKQYNDTYGHQMGDEVLKKVANAIKESLHRADDYCFRLGGEEFGVIFKGDSFEKATLFANVIRTNIENLQIEHKNNSASSYVTVSMGLVSKNAKDIKSDNEIYKQADDLLYKAKENGKNQVVFE